MRTAWESYLYARAVSAWAVRMVIIWFVVLVAVALLGAFPAVKPVFVTVLMVVTLAGGALFLHGLVLELGIAAATPGYKAPVELPREAVLGDAAKALVGLPREAILGVAKAAGVVFVGQLAAGIYVYLLPLHAVWTLLPVLIASILMVVVTGRLLGWSPRPGLVGLWAMSLILFVGITLLAVKESGYADGLAGSVRSMIPSASAAETTVLESAERSSCIWARSTGWTEKVFLVDGRWSDLEKIPPRSEFIVSATAPIAVEFTDGTRYTVHPDECDGDGFGHHDRAHFRVRALDGNVASVTISHRFLR